jgi:uncharacterized protein YuzE
MLRQTFDPSAGAMYLQVSYAPVFETVAVADNVYIDLDASGAPVGLELLGVPNTMPFIAGPEVTAALGTFHFPADARLLMMAARYERVPHVAVTGSRSVEAFSA